MKLVRYDTQSGVYVAMLLKEGPRWIQVILMDSAGIRIIKVRKDEGRYMSDLTYPVKKAARKFLKAGKVFGITKSAKKALKGE